MSIDFNWLRDSVIKDEETPCKDLRLCAVDVWESVAIGGDSIDVKVEQIKQLNDLYLADKDSYDEMTQNGMEHLMKLLAGLIEDSRKEELK